uniref:Uncharacterized protein n=1 Tax=Solanum lycopersicum TaxID=4081 RepID=A0A3Q7G8K0_SOLLC
MKCTQIRNWVGFFLRPVISHALQDSNFVIFTPQSLKQLPFNVISGRFRHWSFNLFL